MIFVMCVTNQEQIILKKKNQNPKFAEIPELELISLAPTPNTPHTNQSITNTTSTPANNSTQQQTSLQSHQPQQHHPPQLLIPMPTQSTNSGTPRAVSPEPTSASTSVKSNFRSWFSTNIPAGGTGAAGSSKQLNNTSGNVTANNSLSGGNSMFDSNSSSTLSNIHPTDGVTTNGNSQQADIQGSYISPALSQLSEQNSSALSSSNAPSTTFFKFNLFHDFEYPFVLSFTCVFLLVLKTKPLLSSFSFSRIGFFLPLFCWLSLSDSWFLGWYVLYGSWDYCL